MSLINRSLINPNFIPNTENKNINQNINANQNIGNAQSFHQIFNTKTNDAEIANNINFSKHASMRLGSRNMQLNPAQMKRLEEGVNKASQKGIKDSLVLVDNVALVVNIKTKTVITAIENDKEKIYSNIDGAVIV